MSKNYCRKGIMTKEEVIAFLEEQRELRLLCYDEEQTVKSDFEKWQLAQAEMFQKIIDWLKERTD